MLKVAVPEVTLYRLPFSVPVPLVPDSVKPSGSYKEEGGKEARDSRFSGDEMNFEFKFSLQQSPYQMELQPWI